MVDASFWAHTGNSMIGAFHNKHYKDRLHICALYEFALYAANHGVQVLHMYFVNFPLASPTKFKIYLLGDIPGLSCILLQCLMMIFFH